MGQFDSDAQIQLNAAALLFSSCTKKYETGELNQDAFHSAVGKYVKKLPDAPVPIPDARKEKTKPPKPPINDKKPPQNKEKGKRREDEGDNSKDEAEQQAVKPAMAGK